MRTCPNCHSPVDDHATICLSCAQELPRSRARAARRVCPTCKGRVGANADFCQWCGHALRDGLAVECEHCGQDNSSDATYCSHCGLRLNEEPDSALCIGCQRPLPAKARFCPACGASQTTTRLPRCPNCQRELPQGSLYCPTCGRGTRPPTPPVYEEAIAAQAQPVVPSLPKWYAWVALLLLGVCVAAISIWALLLPRAAPAAVPAVVAVNTAKGSIRVGAPAYIDGRITDAWQPATLSRIPLWDAAPGQHIVCELAHGAPVEVLEIQRVASESRHYFRVRNEACEGWVLEPALGAGQPL